MATTVQKRKPSRSKKDEPKTLVSNQRKREILGLLTMVVCLLLGLAILTYNPADDLLARRFSLDSLIAPGSRNASNALGLTGAALARVLVPGFLGYFVLFLPIVGGMWGYGWLRNRTIDRLRMGTLLMFGGAYLLATLFGWISISASSDLMSWSGAWGQGTALWMQQILGASGSLIIILALLLTTALLLIDRDIQRTMDRIENGIGAMRAAWKNRAANRRMRKEEEAKEAALEKKRQESDKLEAARQRETERLTRPKETPAPVRPAPAPPRPQPRPTLEDDEENAASGDVEIVVHEQKREEKARRLSRNELSAADYRFDQPGLDILDQSDENAHRIDYEELEENKQILLDKLATYNIEIIAIDAVVGPTVTLFELTPAPGVKISRITALENDIAMALAARGIRIIAPIPGKSAIGVEIPNRHREFVRIRDIIETRTFQENPMELPLILGKSIEGDTVLQDLTKMPHVLIAGSTGSGKSVGVNSFVTGLLYSVPPSLLKFVMIDPKKIELAAYARIASHYVAMPPEADDAIITDVSQALGTLKSCEREMEQRYDLLAKAEVRSIREYNKRFKSGGLDPDDGHRLLPYIVVVVDELADLMMTAGRDIEGPIARLAQMARAIGIHLILATQRPSVDVITGLIKANFPARLAYQVASKIDSRTILDQNGAEGLVGNGDLLYMLGSKITRLQGPFVSNEEIDRITGFIGDQDGPGPYLLPSIEEESGPASMAGGGGGPRDELFEEAARIIVRAQQGSVSLLQRKLSVGYSRAARIVDQLEDAGIVGPFEGSKARAVLVEDELMLDEFLST
jgi:S-DNA-T family DNA segregation ATPase FtsK/SpoIIIE